MDEEKWSMHEVANNTSHRREGKYITCKPGKHFFHTFDHMAVFETIFESREIDTVLA